MKYKPTRGAISKGILKSAIALLCIALATSGLALAASTNNTSLQLTTTMQTVDAPALLKSVSIGGKITINNVELDGEEAAFSLNLQRFEVFKTNAVITVHNAKGEQQLKPTLSAYYRGSIAGKPESVAVLSADPTGAMRGIVQLKGKIWVLAGGQAAGISASGLSSVEIQQSGLSDNAAAFRCDVDKLSKTLQASPTKLENNVPIKALQAGQYYQVPVAIETDAEFYNIFNSTAAATTYIGNLFAYASTIYKQEANAELLVGSVSLWANGANSDPWNHTSTDQGLDDFLSYWKNNHSTTPRAIAHFLSGRNLGGGIAYLGVLCNKNYGYGYSAALEGNFSLANPKPVWDIIVVSHEIGHNFDSDHTHEYQNIGGDSQAVDACYNSNTGPTGTLPGIGSLSGGTVGTGTGTIMSYCHLNSGGNSNISLTFGKNHLYGIKAYRVSDVISNHVAQAAANNPSCITTTTVSETFALNVSTTGNGTVTSSPSGIDCGNDCSESYSKNTQVTLTATPGSDSNFSGWGDACTGTTTCTVTLDAAKTVTASFTLKPAGTPLTITKAGNGTGKVSSVPAGIDCGSDCTESYSNNTQISLIATPDTTSIFTGWTGGDCSGTDSCNVTMDAAKTVTANFALKPVGTPLNVTKAGDGTGSVVSNPVGIDCGNTCSAGYPTNTSVKLTATPATDSTFGGWTGDCKGTSLRCTVKMSLARNVTATFKKIPSYQLNITRLGDGTGKVASNLAGIDCGTACSASYLNKTVVTLAATPDADSTFEGWSTGCSGRGTCKVTMTAAKTITATFKKIPYYLLSVITTAGKGTGKVTSSPAGIECGADCSESYINKTVVTLTAVPDSISTFSGWSGSCSGKATCKVTMTAAKKVTATFAAKPIVLSSSAFTNNKAIPKLYTCDGDNISPPLDWTNIPTGTQSLALIVDDPDAPNTQKMWMHWVAYNFPATTTSLGAGGPLPEGTVEGVNDFGNVGYGGPCPPQGKTHRYFHKLYALDTVLSPSATAPITKAQLEQAMQGHIKGQVTLIGTYKRAVASVSP